MAYSYSCVLFGVHGVIGKALHKKLSERLPDYKIFGFDHARIDATSNEQVSDIINYVKPTVVINCVGMSDPERCEEDKDGAFASNARVPEVIASCCARSRCKLVHFSSYAVFTGRATAYAERSYPRPSNVLGRSKWDGEIAIRRIMADYLIIRPGYLLSPDKRNQLSEWISRAEINGNIVVRDMKVSPVNVVDMADAVMSLIDEKASGVFHVANSGGGVELRSLATSTISMAGLRAKVTQTPSILETWFKAPMPGPIMLSSDKYCKTTGLSMRSWNDALRHCLFTMNKPKE